MGRQPGQDAPAVFSLSTKARAAYLKTGVTDLRLSYEGLFALARTLLHDDLRCGDLFVFCNRQKTRIKILRFDGSGLWVFPA
jgi:transposase